MCIIGCATKKVRTDTPILAWKVFSMYHHDKALTSLFYGKSVEYTPGETYQAKDGHIKLRGILFYGSTGFWSFKTRKLAREFALGCDSLKVRKVMLSGSIVEHTGGYRSQYMKIV